MLLANQQELFFKKRATFLSKNLQRLYAKKLSKKGFLKKMVSEGFPKKKWFPKENFMRKSDLLWK